MKDSDPVGKGRLAGWLTCALAGKEAERETRSEEGLGYNLQGYSTGTHLLHPGHSPKGPHSPKAVSATSGGASVQTQKPLGTCLTHTMTGLFLQKSQKPEPVPTESLSSRGFGRT